MKELLDLFLSLRLLKAWLNGNMIRYWKRWQTKGKVNCLSTQEDQSLALINMISAFMLLIGGIFISVLSLMIEVVTKKIWK